MDDKQTDKVQKKLDDQAESIDRIFGDIRSGMRISITRLHPTWCGGFLERVDVVEDEPVDIDYILRKWGGKRLRLRLSDETGKYIGGADLNLSSYPPRHNYKPIKPGDDWMDDDREPKTKTEIVRAQNPTADPLSIVKEIQKQRQTDMGTMQQLFMTLLKQNQTPKTQNGLDDILAFATKFKQLQGLFGGDGNVNLPAQEDREDEMDMLKTITTLIGALKPAQPSYPQNFGQYQQRSRIVNPANSDIPSSVVKEPVQNPDLTQVLSTMNPEQFQSILLTSLSKMPENNRVEVISAFLEKTGISSLQDLGGWTDEDEFDAEDESDQDTGGALQSDDSYDPADR